MSYFRDVYLKSQDWKSKRAEAIMRGHFTCSLCGVKDIRFDVHHLKYKHLYDVSSRDLRVVCRQCHEKIHRLMVKYPSLSKQTRVKQWKIIRMHLWKLKDNLRNSFGVGEKPKTYKEYREKLREYREMKAELRRQNNPEKYRKIDNRMAFSKARNVLVLMRVAKRKRMKWLDSLIQCEWFGKNPLAILEDYIRISGIDPRYKPYRANPKRLLPVLRSG